MKKKILLALFAAYAFSAQAQFSGKGSGTEKDPYQVTNAEQLYDMRNDLGAYYKLMNDIDLGAWIQDDNPNQGWSPVGNENSPFTGGFDGNNKVVKGLYINRPNMDFQGLFGFGQGAKINNVCLVNPVITGKKNVGAVMGAIAIPNGTYSDLTNNVTIGGTISGIENVGGIVGLTACLGTNSSKSTSYAISYNVSSSTVKGENYVGGIGGTFEGFGYWNSWNKTQYYGDVHLIGNAFYGRITGNKSIGGIAGRTTSGGDNSFESNLFGGTIIGKQATHGLCGTTSAKRVVKNVCFADTICSNEEIKRFCTVQGSDNNAYTGTVIISNNHTITPDDDNYNGTSIGMKTLMRKNAYIGLGFDFDNQWNIVEGETIPFNSRLSVPGKVTEFVSGSRGRISGTASGTGKVYVFVGNDLYESYVLDGKWEVTLGNIAKGTEAKVAVATEGLMPSLMVSAVAEESIVTPTVVAGDANGDGVVDTADVTAIINFILGQPSASFNKENADVNGDGSILIDDAVSTVQLIMNAQ